MRKMMIVAAFAFAMGVAGSAFAATLSNLSGQSCGDSSGTWHFVNNQTGGAAAGTITATFTGEPPTCTTGPDKVLANTQHFICGASGTLTGASTNLPGRLVLSDFSCNEPPKCEKEPCEPPKCEKEPCEPPK